jgi:hypothetical protein
MAELEKGKKIIKCVGFFYDWTNSVYITIASAVFPILRCLFADRSHYIDVLGCTSRTPL